MTLLELVMVVGMMAVVAAGLAPILHGVQRSWAAKEANSDSLANGLAFVHHFHQQLSQASHVTAVSDSVTAKGYIQFIASDGNEVRYDVDVGDNIQFGLPGAPTDLAGPADAMRFTCYDVNDLGTPITDGNSIRLVTVEATLRSSNSSGHSQTFRTSVHLRADPASQGSDEGGLQPGVAMKDKVEWWGSGSVIDSYRSSQGLYNPLQHGTGAIVTVNATGRNKIVLSGGSIIYGDAYIGPGGDVGQGFDVSTDSLITGLRGVLDQEVSIPDLSAPTGPPFSGSHEGNLDLSGSMTRTISTNRYFNRMTLWNNSKVIINGNVTVLLNNRLEMGDNAQLQISAGSSLKLYVYGTVSVWANAKLNAVTKDPARLQLYMIGNNRSFEMADSPEVYAVLQDPKGTVKIYTDAQFFGKIRAKKLTGGGSVHIDLDSDFE